jgi:acyl carrier protein
MTNAEKYDQVFTSTFRVDKKTLSGLIYQGVSAWDSIGHMKMIAELEEAFNIMMETDDILDFSSYMKGYEILKKYGVEC